MNPREDEEGPLLSNLGVEPAAFVRSFLELLANDYEAAIDIIQALKSNDKNDIAEFIDLFKRGYLEDSEQSLTVTQLRVLENLWENPTQKYAYKQLKREYSLDQATLLAEKERESAIQAAAARLAKPLKQENQALQYQLEEVKADLDEVQDDLFKIAEKSKKQQDAASSTIQKQAQEIDDLKSQLAELKALAETQKKQPPSQKSTALRSLLNRSQLENDELASELQSVRKANVHLLNAQKDLRATTVKQSQLISQLENDKQAEIAAAVEGAIEEKQTEIDLYKAEVEDLRLKQAESTDGKIQFSGGESLGRELEKDALMSGMQQASSIRSVIEKAMQPEEIHYKLPEDAHDARAIIQSRIKSLQSIFSAADAYFNTQSSDDREKLITSIEDAISNIEIHIVGDPLHYSRALKGVMNHLSTHTVTKEEKTRFHKMAQDLESYLVPYQVEAEAQLEAEAQPEASAAEIEESAKVATQIAEMIKYMAKKYILSKFSTVFSCEVRFQRALDILSDQRKEHSNNLHKIAKMIKKIGYLSTWNPTKDYDLAIHDAYKVAVLMDLYITAENLQKRLSRDSVEVLLDHVATALNLAWNQVDLFSSPKKYNETLAAISNSLQILLTADQLERISELTHLISGQQSAFHDPYSAIDALIQEAKKQVEQTDFSQEYKLSEESVDVSTPVFDNFFPNSTKDLGKALELIAKKYTERTNTILKNPKLFDQTVKIVVEGVNEQLNQTAITQKIVDNVRDRSAWSSLWDAVVPLKTAEHVTSLIQMSINAQNEQLSPDQKFAAILQCVDAMVYRIGWLDYGQGAELLMVLLLAEQALGPQSHPRLESIRFTIENMGDYDRQMLVFQDLAQDLHRDLHDYRAKEQAQAEQVEPRQLSRRP